MKKSILLILISLMYLSIQINAQSFIDPSHKVEAKVFSYKMSSAPVIDADESEWSNIPWSESRYNDRDFNNDGLMDPMSSRTDYRARWKSAWVDGSNKIYFLFETFDDVIYTADSVRQSHRDNISIRLDPYDEEIGGEPMDDASKNSFSIRFQIDNGENTGYEGNENVKPSFSVKTKVYNNQFPIRTVMEVELTLPSNLALTNGYVMGYYPLYADNDPEDDSPGTKNTVPSQWPQMFSDLGSSDQKDVTGKLLPDNFWTNDFYWGNLECTTLNVHEVAAGASIQAAIDAAGEGDIINIAAGTYTENIVINKPYIQLVGTMTATDTTKLYPADGQTAIIKTADNDDAYGVVIKNIAFYGWATDETGARVTGDKGVEIGSAQTEVLGSYFTGFDKPIRESDANDSSKAFACVIEDNYLYACTGGINIHTPASVIRYNTIEENTGGYGVESKGLISGYSVDIAFNTVFNHHGECGIGYGGAGVFTIHHNMLLRSEELYGAGDTSGDDGIENQDTGGSTDYIYNNTIVGWKSDGMQLGGSSKGSSNYKIRNNLIAHNGGKDFDIRQTGSTDIDFGLGYMDKGGEIITNSAHALLSDPMFANEFENDFTITESSPAVDAGEFEPFGFKIMYFGDRPDIGAFETGTVVTSVENDANAAIPTNYNLSQNYPNPFNPSTTISFSIPKNGIVSLKVYNVIGQLVSTLANGEFASGTYKINFDASKLASGIYFYSLHTGEYSVTKKMLLIK